MAREFAADFNHPAQLLIRQKQRDLLYKLDLKDRIVFIFPDDSAEDREALEGWAHAMRFWADSVLGKS